MPDISFVEMKVQESEGRRIEVQCEVLGSVVIWGAVLPTGVGALVLLSPKSTRLSTRRF